MPLTLTILEEQQQQPEQEDQAENPQDCKNTKLAHATPADPNGKWTAAPTRFTSVGAAWRAHAELRRGRARHAKWEAAGAHSRTEPAAASNPRQAAVLRAELATPARELSRVEVQRRDVDIVRLEDVYGREDD